MQFLSNVPVEPRIYRTGQQFRHEVTVEIGKGQETLVSGVEARLFQNPANVAIFVLLKYCSNAVTLSMKRPIVGFHISYGLRERHCDWL